MQIATAVSLHAEPALAVQEAWTRLCERLGGVPDLILLTCTESHAPAQVVEAMDALTSAPWAGGTSCQGLMTEEGVFLGRHVLGLWGVCDPAGAYGIGAASLGADPRAATVEALEAALRAADRPGERPELVWLIGCPGSEEAVLEGVEDVLGGSVPCVGGSTADDTVAGRWQQLAPGWHGDSGVVLAVFMPSVPVRSHFHSGYVPTELRARVTAARGRTLHTLGGEPAAVVYNRWTRGTIEAQLAGGSVLMETSLHPLGREVHRIGAVPTYVLTHPEAVGGGQSLRLFTDIEEGDELVLMAGTREGLLTRAGRVAVSARRQLPGALAGALVTYCAGCMLTVREDMAAAQEGLRQALGGRPFLGNFTFGEQGAFLDKQNRHGNLMISVVALGGDR